MADRIARGEVMDFKQINDCHRLVNKRYAAMLLALIETPSLFNLPPRRRSFVQRITARVKDIAGRVRDAWLVLKGDAYIADEDY
jgi:hypothetical protein